MDEMAVAIPTIPVRPSGEFSKQTVSAMTPNPYFEQEFNLRGAGLVGANRPAGSAWHRN